MEKKRILIIDDEEHIVQLLRINMKTHGFDCASAFSGEEGLALIPEYNPDLILLDVMLPGIDGVEVCRRLKNNSETKRIPVLMLSARSQGRDKITGLEGGADDYITKPFSLQELFLRIKAALRQVDLLTKDQNPVFTAGTLLLDTEKYLVTSRERKIDLTLTEFRILNVLLKNMNSVVLRETLIKDIFNKDPLNGGRAVDVHIRNIRRKLSESNVAGCTLETVRGSGYKISSVLQ